MAEPITVDTILNYLQQCIEEKIAVAPSVWIDAASKLNVLLGNEHDRLCTMEQEVANLKLHYLAGDEKQNVSAAKAKVEASNEYLAMRKQKLLCERILEFIRLAKARARMLSEELRSS